MFESLEVLRLSRNMAINAAQRQAVVALNIANADTPGYRAQFVPVFEQSEDGLAMRATRTGHINAVASESTPRVVNRPDVEIAPNGNSVSIETEMGHAIEARRQHNQSIAIYRSTLDVLRAALGR